MSTCRNTVPSPLRTGIVVGVHSFCRVDGGNIGIGVRVIKSLFLKGDGVCTGWSYYKGKYIRKGTNTWMAVIGE
jgi:hypothetical protein